MGRFRVLWLGVVWAAQAALTITLSLSKGESPTQKETLRQAQGDELGGRVNLSKAGRP